jgi:hypothetical protein
MTTDDLITAGFTLQPDGLLTLGGNCYLTLQQVSGEWELHVSISPSHGLICEIPLNAMHVWEDPVSVPEDAS